MDAFEVYWYTLHSLYLLQQAARNITIFDRNNTTVAGFRAGT